MGRVQAAAKITSVAVLVCLATFGFSRGTGRLAESATAPVGTFSLIAAIVLTVWAPARFGWRWGCTGREWRLVLAALAGVVAVVGAYRLVSAGAPYEASVAEFAIVPLGEEALFRGFVLTMLAVLFARWLPQHSATWWAIIVGAFGFGIGHVGNLGYVQTEFVLFQAVIATAFGLLAGWVRVRTDSLVGPVLLHAAMNIVAVV
jgi:hypothetical protein